MIRAVMLTPTKRPAPLTRTGHPLQTHHGKKPRMIGKLIRTYRQVHGITVRGLAAHLHISSASISRIERGYEFDASTWHRLCCWLLGAVR